MAAAGEAILTGSGKLQPARLMKVGGITISTVIAVRLITQLVSETMDLTRLLYTFRVY